MKVIDLHCDALSVQRNILRSGGAFNLLKNDRHVDLEKLERGDYLLQCFAVYYHASPDDPPLKSALEQIDVFYRMLEMFSDRMAQVRTWGDIEANRKSGKISALLTIEDGGCCMGSLGALRQLHRLGARMMTLTWNYENVLAYPNVVPDNATTKSECHPVTKGLKPLGFEFLAEMEQLGIIVDVSHLSDGGFWDVCHAAKRPFIASHADARALSNHVRNLTDEMLCAIAEHGGIVGINYHPPFLDAAERDEDCQGTVENMVRHIIHIRNVAGIDSIALGSDFDGIEGNLEIKNCGEVQKLVQALENHGFTNVEIEKIFYKNALRIFREFL